MCRTFLKNPKIINCWEHSDLFCTQAKKKSEKFPITPQLAEEFEFALTAHSLNTDAGRSGSAFLNKSIRINGIALDLPQIQLKQDLVYEVHHGQLYKLK